MERTKEDLTGAAEIMESTSIGIETRIKTVAVQTRKSWKTLPLPNTTAADGHLECWAVLKIATSSYGQRLWSQ